MTTTLNSKDTLRVIERWLEVFFTFLAMTIVFWLFSAHEHQQTG